MSAPRIGLLVNPVAGLGGRVGLKGSDGRQAQERARALGAVPRAGERAAAALAELAARTGRFTLLTAAGPMGADAASAAGLPCETVHEPARPVTTPADTAHAVRALLTHSVDLLLFAGGDGTARDVHDALGPGPAAGTPVLGIPTGVKMHSAVFAVNPRAAGEVAAACVRSGGRVRLRKAEVMDRDEEALRAGHVTARLHGWLPVPFLPARVQQRKTGSTAGSPSSVAGIAAELTARLSEHRPLPCSGSAGRGRPGAGPGTAAGRGGEAAGDTEAGEGTGILVLGPGTTTRDVAAALGADIPPTAVNVLRVGRSSATVLATDVTAAGLLALAESGGNIWIAVSPIGGQGFLLGRGNQQLTPELLRTIGTDRLTVLCTETKLAALAGRPLLVDTGDDTLDRELSGYRQVITGRRTTTIHRVAH